MERHTKGCLHHLIFFYTVFTLLYLHLGHTADLQAAIKSTKHHVNMQRVQAVTKGEFIDVAKKNVIHNNA